MGPYQAAGLGAWTLSRTRDTYTLAAQIVQADAYWLAQAPTSLRLSMGTRSWVWAHPHLQIESTTVSAALDGPPETR